MQTQRSSDKSANARRLQQIAARVEAFLTAQIERLEQTFEECRNVLAQREAVDRLLADIGEQRKKWEQERRRERQQLRQSAEQISEAWNRLEAEQRQLLSGRESREAGSNDVERDTRLAAGEDPAPNEPWDQTAPRGPTPSGSGTERPPTVDAASLESARLQFQQLKREIRKHARRGR